MIEFIDSENEVNALAKKIGRLLENEPNGEASYALLLNLAVILFESKKEDVTSEECIAMISKHLLIMFKDMEEAKMKKENKP